MINRKTLKPNYKNLQSYNNKKPKIVENIHNTLNYWTAEYKKKFAKKTLPTRYRQNFQAKIILRDRNETKITNTDDANYVKDIKFTETDLDHIFSKLNLKKQAGPTGKG
jgi:hypothetical protein